ncbi:hypothetical protein E2C01_057982 [Portunus trituberculatus]|uniref:Uncharacterized protein n=1 Tax=Portunus trituberculatus TaxID=210409 RepID=A0A5B7H4U1_PORTR|nr:hypothetical protein [Portunus trituberculatus]
MWGGGRQGKGKGRKRKVGHDNGGRDGVVKEWGSAGLRARRALLGRRTARGGVIPERIGDLVQRHRGDGPGAPRSSAAPSPAGPGGAPQDLPLHLQPHGLRELRSGRLPAPRLGRSYPCYMSRPVCAAHASQHRLL